MITSPFLRICAAVLLAAGLSVGCGDSATTGTGHGDSPEDHGHGDHEDGNHGDDERSDDGDEFAQAACHGLHAEGTTIHAALDHEGAAELTMASDGTTWVVHLPEGVPSYASITLATDHTDWAVFVDHPGVVVSLTNHENDRFDIVPENPNEACPDEMAVDARVHIHSGGHYTVEFSGEGAREIRFQMVSEAEGHVDGGDADPISQSACHVIDGEHVMVAASSTPEEAMAGDVIMTGGSFHRVLLPDGPAYVMVHLPTDHTDWAVFLSDPNVALVLRNDEVGTFGITPHNPNPACIGAIQVDTRIHIHAGGLFVLEFAGGGPDHILFNMVSEADGHGDGEHDEHTDDG